MKLAKKIIIAMLGFSMFAVQAADNTVYIDQTGSNSNIVVNQDGAGNKVGGLGGAGPGDINRAIMHGNSQNINLNQVGSGNTMQLNIQSVNATGNDNANNSTVFGINEGFGNIQGNNYIYSAVGNNNSAVIDSNSYGAAGGSDSNNLGVDIVGGSNATKFGINGTSNTVVATIGSVTATSSGNTLNSVMNGNNNQQTVRIGGGNSNVVNAYQGQNANLSSNIPTSPASDLLLNGLSAVVTSGSTSDNGVITLNLTGSSNNVNLGQIGTSESALSNITGTSNNINVTQNGANDVFVLNLNGTSNIMNVTQTSTGGNTNTLDIKSNISGSGSNNRFTITQNAH